jgi:hypothetical protein
LPKRFPPPRRDVGRKEPIGILELDRFSEATLNRWREISGDLDELQAVLYFNLLPEQRRVREHLLAAIITADVQPLVLDNWVRIVTYQYSQAPLSCAGSLQAYGGRFNPGVDLDPGTLAPWPALYVGADYETAFREKFQLPSTETVNGLSPQELALQPGQSHSTVVINGRLARVFDMRTPASLEPIARVLRRIRMPQRAKDLKRKLSIPRGGLTMIQNGQSLFNAMVQLNWRSCLCSSACRRQRMSSRSCCVPRSSRRSYTGRQRAVEIASRSFRTSWLQVRTSSLPMRRRRASGTPALTKHRRQTFAAGTPCHGSFDP